jgi:hypothetical protein
MEFSPPFPPLCELKPLVLDTSGFGDWKMLNPSSHELLRSRFFVLEDATGSIEPNIDSDPGLAPLLWVVDRRVGAHGFFPVPKPPP